MDAEWKQVYSYVGKTTSFKTYAAEALPGLTVTHDKVGSKRSKTTYTIHGRKTESPSQAVKWYNAKIRHEINGGRPAAGSVEQIRQSRGDAGV